MTSCRFSRWRILDFRGPIMGSLKSPFTTSYRSSIETIALNCFVFEKISFLQFGDRQTDKQTNRWTRPSHEAALAVASNGLIRSYFHKILSCPLWCVPLIFGGIVWRLLDGLRLQFSDGRMMNDTSLFLCCARPHFSLAHSPYLSICRWMCVCVRVSPNAQCPPRLRRCKEMNPRFHVDDVHRQRQQTPLTRTPRRTDHSVLCALYRGGLCDMILCFKVRLKTGEKQLA